MAFFMLTFYNEHDECIINEPLLLICRELFKLGFVILMNKEFSYMWKLFFMLEAFF